MIDIWQASPLVALLLLTGTATSCTLLFSESDLVGGSPDAAVAVSADGAAMPTSAEASVETSDGLGTPDAAQSHDATLPPMGPVAIYSGLVAPLGIAVSGGTICWVEGETVRSVKCGPTSGGSVQTVATQADDPNVAAAFDVAFDSANVYWSTGANATVMRKPLLDGGPSSLFFNNGLPIGYIVRGESPDAGIGIWGSDYVPAASTGADIWFGPIGSRASEQLYGGQPGAAGVALYADTLYWGLASAGALRLGPKEGKAAPGQLTQVDAGGPVTGVAVDTAGTAYFVVSDQNVVRLPPGGAVPVPFYRANQPLGGGDVAVDQDSVYLSERAAGVIMRLPK